MNNYELVFQSFCWQGYEGDVPESPGIYCAYSCSQNGSRQEVDRLLYIGRSQSLRSRLQQHTHDQDLNRDTERNKRIFYSYALLDGRQIDACEAAMILHFNPPYNDRNSVSLGAHGETRVSVSGQWAFRIRGIFVEQPA